MRSWFLTKYTTINWSHTNDSLKQRESLSIWFDREMAWVPAPTGKRGQQHIFSDTTIQTYLTLKVLNLPCRGGTGSPNLLIDSTGIKSEGEGEWNVRKHGELKRRIWRAMHIDIEEGPLEVEAIEVTTNNVDNAPILADLLPPPPDGQDINSVTTDEVYDTRKHHDAIAARGVHAVIPPSRNAKPWKPISAEAISCNEAGNASRYLGRARRR